MFKKNKILVELIAKKETEEGGIGLLEGVKFMQEIGKVADKNGFDAFVKGYPKEVLDYVPTGNRYQIKTVEDIAKLTAEQFEMFIEDLRNFCDIMRGVDAVNGHGIETKTNDGMTRIDSGEHSTKVIVKAEMTEQETLDRIERLESLIQMLKEDIECFGPAGDDIARLNGYRREKQDLILSLRSK